MGFLDRFKSDGPRPPDALTYEIVARLRVLGATESVEPVDADTVRVTWHGGPDQSVELGELRPTWKRSSGFDRIQLLDDFVEGVRSGGAAGSSPAPDDEVAPPPVADEPVPVPIEEVFDSGGARLRPTLLRALRPAGTADEDAVVWPFGDGAQIVALDIAAGTEITRADVDRLDVSAGEVEAAALKNLEALDPAPEPIGDGMRAWVPTTPAGLKSSWLLAPHRLLEACGLSSAIGFAPLPDELVVIDPADEGLVGAIATSTMRILEEQPGTLVAAPLEITRDAVDVWDPPADHPAAAVVAEMKERFGAG